MVKTTVAVVAALAVFSAGMATVHATSYFTDKFDSDPFESDRWVHSSWKKSDSSKFEYTAGAWPADEEENKGIMTSQDFRFHSVSAKLNEAIASHTLGKAKKDLVIQFQVKNQFREYSFCGGGYIKLLGGMNPKKFGGDTDYAIMFGPDMCGYDVSRIHVIFTDKKGKNLLKEDEVKLEYSDKNEFSHVYTLHLKKNGEYEVFFDQKSKASGSIVDGWDFEKKQIDDPEDKKPSDWVDTKKIDDPEDVKPEGWDDIAEKIRDPEAKKPEDWDDEDDGEWEAPMISNPEYKGEWSAKRIDNPEYKGEWKAKQIDNENYDEELVTWDDLQYVGFELWSVNNGSIFDNIYVGDSLEEAKQLATDTWATFKDNEKAAKDKYDEAKKAEEKAASDDEGEDEEDEDEEEEEEEKGDL